METNPAKELFELCEFLNTRGNNKAQTREVLAKNFGCQNPNDPVFLELLAVIAKRFSRLGELVLVSEAIPNSVREDSINAIAHLSQITFTDGLTTQWSSRRGQVFLPDHLKALKFISGIFEKGYSLRKLSNEDRTKLLGTIEAAISEIKADETQTIAHDATIKTLESLKTVLSHLPYFGIEELYERLLWANSNLRAAETYAPTGKAKKAVNRGLVVLGLIVGAMNYGSDTIDSTVKFYGYGQKAIEYLSQELPKETPAITDQRSDKTESDNNISSKSATSNSEDSGSGQEISEEPE